MNNIVGVIRSCKNWAKDNLTNSPNYDALLSILNQHVLQSTGLKPTLYTKSCRKAGPDFETRVYVRAGNTLYSALGFDTTNSPKGKFAKEDVYFFQEDIGDTDQILLAYYRLQDKTVFSL